MSAIRRLVIGGVGEFVVPYALAKSGTVEVGAKGFIRERSRQGMFYTK